MGVYVSALNTIYTRLTTAQGSGLKLSDFKYILCGPRELIEKIEDCPSIVISLESITENYGSGTRNSLNADAFIKLWVKVGINDMTPGNLYFNSVAGTGMLYGIEKIGDVLNETTGQALDPRGGATSQRAYRLSFGDFEKKGDKYIYSLEVKLTTPEFLINGRAT